MTKTTTVREAFDAMIGDDPYGVLWLNGRAIADIQRIETDYFMLVFADGGDDAVDGITEIEQDL